VSDPTPVLGYEDLYPHVAMLDGEEIFRIRAVAALIAPSIDDLVAECERQEPLIRAGLMERFRLPDEWQYGARRRSNELMARYNTDAGFEVLRGLEREYGALSRPLPALDGAS
jgi:hypothetical protein